MKKLITYIIISIKKFCNVFKIENTTNKEVIWENVPKFL